MRRILKTTIGPLLVGLTLLVNLQFQLMIPPVIAAKENSTDKPQIRLGPEIKIKPQVKSDSKSDKDKKGWFSRNKWWVALGAILAGGTAAALATGGSSSDDGSGGDGDGTFSMKW